MKTFQQFLNERLAGVGTVACPSCSKQIASNTEVCPFCDTHVGKALAVLAKRKRDDQDMADSVPWDKAPPPKDDGGAFAARWAK